MKRTFTILIFFLGFNNFCQAQFAGHYNALNVGGSSNVFKTEVPMAPPTTIGSTYLDDQWQDAQIILKDGSNAGTYPVKVEVEHANIELKFRNDVRFLNFEKIDFVTYVEKSTELKGIVTRASNFTYQAERLHGIMLIYGRERAKYTAAKNLSIEFLASNYNVAMDVGSKDNRKVKKEKLFILTDGRLILIKGPDKKIAKQFGDDRDKVLSIVREHNLKLTREKDLVEFAGLMSGNAKP